MSTANKVGPMPGTPEWHRLRAYDPESGRVVFGASEAAAALGVSPYCTPLELFLRKTGRMDSDSDSEAMEMGNLLEPVVLTLYERKTGRTLTRNHPFYFHPQWDFMGCTPDAIGTDEDREPIAVDAKTSNWRMLDAASDDKWGEGGDAVPVEYLCQAQQQAAVLGLGRVDFPVLFDGRSLRIYTVPLDSELIAAIASAEQELAERIRDNDPPEPNWTHPNTARCLRNLYGLRQESISLSSEAAGLWAAISDRKKAISELERLNEADKNRILAEMKSAEVAVLPCGSKELRRVAVGESVYTIDDVAELRAKVGEVKRRGYERLTERKVKK